MAPAALEVVDAAAITLLTAPSYANLLRCWGVAKGDAASAQRRILYTQRTPSCPRFFFFISNNECAHHDPCALFLISFLSLFIGYTLKRMLTIKLAVVVVQLLALISLSECANINQHHRRHHLDRNRRSEWSCPPVQQDTPPGISCQCDLPHTLRCAGQSAVPEDDVTAIVGALRALPEEHSVSLLDLSIQNLSRLSSELFEQVTLHGLVISSGEIRDVSPDAFAGAALASALTALGLPNNRLTSVPSDAPASPDAICPRAARRQRSVRRDAELGHA